jgi:poly-gamma-glutamate synthesis protein (capsule biosynthesis protein)
MTTASATGAGSALATALLVLLPAAAAQQVTLLAGGDTEKSPRPYGPPAAYTHNPAKWVAVPFLNLEENRDAIRARTGRQDLDESAHYRHSYWPTVTFASAEDERRYPFQRSLDLLRGADVTFANLEMPLSDGRCRAGATCGAPAFADTLRWAGLDVISLANNRTHDAETAGLLDTMAALTRAGVGWIGAGRNLADARRPLVVERNGLKLAFLGYSYGSAFGLESFVRPDAAGIMPLDPLIIREDIRRVRDQVDFVILSFHWGILDSQDVHPEERRFGQEMIDAGADVILGHHPHVPKGVEVYRNGVIIYSLGNFTMGHGHDDPEMLDNFLARLTFERGGIARIEVIPWAGVGLDIAQPYQLQGERAQALLRSVQQMSAKVDTEMAIDGDVGVIRPPASRRR